MASQDSPEQGAHGDRRRPGRALLEKFVSADSYGLVLVLVVVTYVVSVSFVAGWAQSVVLAIQLATVWLTFRTARTPLSARVIVLLVFLAVAAVAFVNLFITVTSEPWPFLPRQRRAVRGGAVRGGPGYRDPAPLSIRRLYWGRSPPT